jgi:hypothetical protein
MHRIASSVVSQFRRALGAKVERMRGGIDRPYSPVGQERVAGEHGAKCSPSSRINDGEFRRFRSREQALLPGQFQQQAAAGRAEPDDHDVPQPDRRPFRGEHFGRQLRWADEVRSRAVHPLQAEAAGAQRMAQLRIGDPHVAGDRCAVPARSGLGCHRDAEVDRFVIIGEGVNRLGSSDRRGPQRGRRLRISQELEVPPRGPRLLRTHTRNRYHPLACRQQPPGQQRGLCALPAHDDMAAPPPSDMPAAGSVQRRCAGSLGRRPRRTGPSDRRR